MYQPHATLSAVGAKTIETRPFETKHRGWVAIHAAKTSPAEYTDLAKIDPFLRVLQATVRGYDGIESLPTGAIVGVYWLAAVMDAVLTTERWKQLPAYTLPYADYDDVPMGEAAFGDYTRGRKAWWTTNIVALPEPIPCSGAQGMWDTRMHYPDLPASAIDPLEAKVREQLLDTDVRMIDAWDDPAFWRLVNRRGTLGHPPRER
jgi:hypothetical protein